MNERSFGKAVTLGSLVPSDRPICYGVLKPGEYDRQGVPLIRIVDITDIQLVESGLFRISKTLDREFSRSRIFGGEILLSIQGTIGRAVVAGRALKGANISRTIARIAVNETTDPRYVRYWLLSETGQNAIQDAVVGTTRDSLNLRQLRLIELEIPSLAHQQRIADIIDSVDDRIRLLEKEIEKCSLASKALAIQLLTSGVRQPDAAREKSTGAPRDWITSPLAPLGATGRAYLKTGPFGSSLKQEHWVDEGVPVVTIGSLGEGCFMSSELLHIAPRTASYLSAYALEPGDVVFSRVADVGRSVVVTEEQRGWVMSSNLMWISLDQKRIDPRFLRASIAQNPSIRTQIRRLVNSSGRDVANAAIMNRLQFTWPTLTEQREIADIIDSQRASIDSLRQIREKLVAVKLGLMSDLLTGRVRVPAETLR